MKGRLTFGGSLSLFTVPRHEDALPSTPKGLPRNSTFHVSAPTVPHVPYMPQTSFFPFQSKKLRHRAWQGRSKSPNMNVYKPP